MEKTSKAHIKAALLSFRAKSQHSTDMRTAHPMHRGKLIKRGVDIARIMIF